ncbi:MAG: hypothetical protein ACLFQV_08745, partial [Vulcanimicrobiota bacterium]
MKNSYSLKKICLIFLLGILVVFSLGLSESYSEQCMVKKYPIDSNVQTTKQRTIVLSTTFSGTLIPQDLYKISEYDKYGYGIWSYGPGLDPEKEKRTDIMPEDYDAASVTKTTKLLHFFTMSD